MSDGLLIQTMKGILARLDQIDEIKAEIKEEYAQAKAAGFDKTALGGAIREIRGRDKAETPAAQERATIVELYVSTFDNAPRTYVHVPAREAGPTIPSREHAPVTQEATHVDRSASARPLKAGGADGQDGITHPAIERPNFEQPSGADTGSAVRSGAPVIKGLAAAAEIAARAAQPTAPKPERADIDIEIPAFLRRTNGGNHPSFGEQA